MKKTVYLFGVLLFANTPLFSAPQLFPLWLCEWVGKIVSNFALSKSDNKEEKEHLQSLADEYNKKKIALIINNAYLKAYAFIEREKKAIQHSQMGEHEKEAAYVQVSQEKYKEVLEDMVLVDEDDASCSKTRKFLNLPSKGSYNDIFNEYEKPPKVDLISGINTKPDKVLFEHVKFCQERLKKIGLGINTTHEPFISSSVYKLIIAIDAFTKNVARNGLIKENSAYTHMVEAAEEHMNLFFPENRAIQGMVHVHLVTLEHFLPENAQ